MTSRMGLKGGAAGETGEFDVGVHRQLTLLPGLMHSSAPVQSWLPPQAAWVKNNFHQQCVYILWGWGEVNEKIGERERERKVGCVCVCIYK